MIPRKLAGPSHAGTHVHAVPHAACENMAKSRRNMNSRSPRDKCSNSGFPRYGVAGEAFNTPNVYGAWAMNGWEQIFFYDPDGNIIEVHQDKGPIG